MRYESVNVIMSISNEAILRVIFFYLFGRSFGIVLTLKSFPELALRIIYDIMHIRVRCENSSLTRIDLHATPMCFRS